jgi:hypothetical protein
MKITRLQPPTIEEVQRTISALEKEFHVSSAKFASSERTYRAVPEDIAADWDLALQQLDVLRPVETVCYWQTASGPQCEKQCDADERREAVAA